MPFETLENLTKDNMPPTASVSYLRYVRKGNEKGRATAKPRLIISVPTRIVVSKHERFIVQAGTGADSRKLRVVGVSAKSGPRSSVKANVFKTHLMLRFGHIPRLPDEIFQEKQCPIVRIDDDTYEIDIGIEVLPQAAPENVVAHPQLKRA